MHNLAKVLTLRDAIPRGTESGRNSRAHISRGIEGIIGVRNDRKGAPARNLAPEIGDGGAHVGVVGLASGIRILRSTAASSRPTLAW